MEITYVGQEKKEIYDYHNDCMKVVYDDTSVRFANIQWNAKEEKLYHYIESELCRYGYHSFLTAFDDYEGITQDWYECEDREEYEDIKKIYLQAKKAFRHRTFSVIRIHDKWNAKKIWVIKHCHYLLFISAQLRQASTQ